MLAHLTERLKGWPTHTLIVGSLLILILLVSMADFVTLFGMIRRLTMLTLGGYGAFIFLKWLDMRSGLNFKDDILPLIKSNPLAAGLYYGLRYAATMLAVGWVVAS